MLLEMKNDIGTFKFRTDNIKLNNGEHKATIIKYKKVLTFFYGLYDLPGEYGKIDFEIKDDILFVSSFELNNAKRKDYEKFVKETKTLFEKFFGKIKEENNLSEIKFADDLFVII